MPKLIIPNAYELYRIHDANLTQVEAHERFLYCCRFIWLLEHDDILLLPTLPNAEFMAYFADLKRIDLKQCHIIPWSSPLTSSFDVALSNPPLLQTLKALILSPQHWTIHTCYFNSTILDLADQLQIPITAEWRQLIAQDFIRHCNSKIYFRQLAKQYQLPIPNGEICHTQKALVGAMRKLLLLSKQLIVKQVHNAGGRGNIGISMDRDTHFTGVKDILYLNKPQDISKIAHLVWTQYTDRVNPSLIIEIYYPNQGTFTAMVWIPPPEQKPILLNYSEIRMAQMWIGVQIPAHKLNSDHSNVLVHAALQFAELMQTQGYHGFMCVDAIKTNDEQILLTEVNVRPGAETNAHILATCLFGKDYYQQTTILTRRGLPLTSLTNTLYKLKEANLLLTSQSPYGVALLTVDDQYTQEAEYLIAAPNLKLAETMETHLREIW